MNSRWSKAPYAILLVGWLAARTLGTEVFPSTISFVIGLGAARVLDVLISTGKISTLQFGVLEYIDSPISYSSVQKNCNISLK